MEEVSPKVAMTSTFPILEDWPIGHVLRMTSLALLFPALLVAAMLEQSPTDPSLPEPESYRSPFSDSLLESNRWRVPQQVEEPDWRLPPPPPVGWRTPPKPQSETSATKRTIELFPRYQPGKPSDYDLIEQEEKPLIKMFEFGSK